MFITSRLNPLVRALALVCALYLPSHAQAQAQRVAGVVLDQAGAPVAGAEVSLGNGSRAASSVTTGADGRFSFAVGPGASGTLTVQAQGFAPYRRELRAGSAEGTNLRIVLEPAPVAEQVTVTAMRAETRLSETAASVMVLSARELGTTAAATLDDALRQSPGFSLFRRSGSRTANPTSQGVSLRGVGASGASRAVVLDDGIPISDPFGGWIYWGRVPRESVERVEILRGGASDLYGSAALGGVINILTQRPRATGLSLDASYGNQQTPDASLSASVRLGQWGARLAAEAFETKGYVLVDKDERGRIDRPAGGRHTTLDLMLERAFSDQRRAFLRGAIFDESRQNGSPLQTNETYIRQLSAGLDWGTERWGSFSARLYGGPQVYDQVFTAIAADRNSETLTRRQRVPAQSIGVLSQWSRAAGARAVLVAGFDGREVRGASDELVYGGGRATSLVGAGGRERAFGLFAQNLVRVTSRAILTVGARFDRWRNYDARSTTQRLTPPLTTTVINFPDRTETALSPRASVLLKATASLSFTIAGYRAFRAPTLNELYRAFRVGDVLTLANENLRAERLAGGEAGAILTPFGGRARLRSVFFWSEITRPIANVTLAVTPALITRQRQNLGRTRSRGLELEGETRLTQHWSLSAGYLLTDAVVRRFPANTSLEGLWIPQVPRHQLTFQAQYTNPATVTLGLQGRASGAQFDDDQNLFRLDKYLTLDALVLRRLARNLDMFVAAENLFNQRYEIGRTPVTTLGPPRLIRLGIRLRLGSR